MGNNQGGIDTDELAGQVRDIWKKFVFNMIVVLH